MASRADMRSVPELAAAATEDAERAVRLALSNEKRILLLKWLGAPSKQFQSLCPITGKQFGVRLPLIMREWNVSEATTIKHLGRLIAANLLLVTVEAGTKCYRRNEAVISAVRANMRIFWIS